MARVASSLLIDASGAASPSWKWCGMMGSVILGADANTIQSWEL